MFKESGFQFESEVLIKCLNEITIRQVKAIQDTKEELRELENENSKPHSGVDVRPFSKTFSPKQQSRFTL